MKHKSRRTDAIPSRFRPTKDAFSETALGWDFHNSLIMISRGYAGI